MTWLREIFRRSYITEYTSHHLWKLSVSWRKNLGNRSEEWLLFVVVRARSEERLKNVNSFGLLQDLLNRLLSLTDEELKGLEIVGLKYVETSGIFSMHISGKNH
jgi:hypothetical protein